MWHVYMLKSARKQWYYVGSTNRLEKRLQEHNRLKVRVTKAFAPLNLVFVKEFTTEKEARLYERKLKDQRKAKEEIIRNLRK